MRAELIYGENVLSEEEEIFLYQKGKEKNILRLFLKVSLFELNLDIEDLFFAIYRLTFHKEG